MEDEGACCPFSDNKYSLAQTNKNYFNPPMADRIIFSDFREKFPSCSLWLLEFRFVGILAIS